LEICLCYLQLICSWRFRRHSVQAYTQHAYTLLVECGNMMQEPSMTCVYTVDYTASVFSLVILTKIIYVN